MDNQRKNRWRKQEFERVRRQRVINGYIEKKHPEIYKDAFEFYKFLDEKYPEKKDLRLANEFEWVKTGISGQTTRRFYTRKEKRTTTTTTVVNDQMKLVIPLMTKTTTKAKSAASQPQAEPFINDEQPPVETQLPVETQPNDEQPPLEPAEIVIDSTTSFEPTLNEEIPDKIIKEIISGLENDPYLKDFFPTIDIEFDEESPLERELIQW